MSVKEAFFSVCEDAKPAVGTYVSLYVRVPYYGGPEEGGWWGEDHHLVAYKHCTSSERAAAVREAVESLALELSEQAQREFGDTCLREMAWLDARGLDAGWLPEPDGEAEYYVAEEKSPGSLATTGCRHYE